jgi:hypothetical protein
MNQNDEIQPCPSFESCSAPICPLECAIYHRKWYIGEDICTLQEHRGLPFIQRQRKLNRLRPPSLMGKLFTFAKLVKTAPKKRKLSPEHKAKLLEAAKRHQFAPKPVSENREIEVDLTSPGDNGGEPERHEITVLPAEFMEETSLHKE